MRKTAWMTAVTFWILAAACTSDIPPSFAKDKAPPDPPACPAKFDDSLETDGIVGDFRKGVTAPRATFTPIAEFSDKARKEGRKHHMNEFVSLISMVVGVDGIPRDVCLVKAAGYDLDAKAAEAAWKYRFKPAMKDGEAVPARVTMEVSFRLR
jgi:hypothetical protein